MKTGSLLARTHLPFYSGHVARLRKMGASEKEIDKQIGNFIFEASELLAGKCPKCGAPSARYVDYGRQQGSSEAPGAWVMYRCSTAPPPGEPRRDACDFMVDYIEGDASN